MTHQQKRLIAQQLCSQANQKEPIKRKFLKLSSIAFWNNVAVYYGDAGIYEVRY